MSNRVLYMILRADLISDLKWPLGAVFTQIAHASTACIWTYREDEDVKAYMADLRNMHKVTLKVENEAELLAEAQKLKEKKIEYTVWVEDKMSVCVCLKPYPREFIKPLLKHLPLYK